MAIVTSGLVHEYVGKLAKNGTLPGNNTDPTGTWIDTVGSADGTLTGADYTTDDGWVGDGSAGSPYALHSAPSATGVYASFTNDATWRQAAITAELWINPLVADASYTRNFFDIRGATNYGFRAYLLQSSMQVNIAWGTGAAIDTTAIGTCTDNTWAHIVITYDGTLKTYFNDDGTPTSEALAYGVNTTVAPTLFSTVRFAHASIATFRWYDRALSAAEVTQNYTAGVLAASTDSAGGIRHNFMMMGVGTA